MRRSPDCRFFNRLFADYILPMTGQRSTLPRARANEVYVNNEGREMNTSRAAGFSLMARVRRPFKGPPENNSVLYRDRRERKLVESFTGPPNYRKTFSTLHLGILSARKSAISRTENQSASLGEYISVPSLCMLILFTNLFVILYANYT